MRQNKFQAPAAACSRSSSSSFTAHPSLCSVCRDRRRSHLKIHTKAGKDAPLCQKIGSFPTLPLFLLFFVAEIANLAGFIPPIFPLLLLQPGTPFAYFAPIPLPQNMRACRRGRSRAKEDWPTRPASFLLFFVAEIADLARLIPPIFPLLLLQPGTPFAYFAPIPLPQNMRACRRGRSRAKEDWPTRPASFFTLLHSRNCGSGQAYSANLLLPSPTVPSTLWHPASARSHTAKRRRSV